MGVSLQKPHIDALTAEALAAALAGMGQPAYRAKQLFGWLHKAQVESFDAMTNLPAALREQLAQGWALGRGKLAQAQHSGDGTAKLLVELADGNCVETVLMRYQSHNSVCISCQVGCRMGCTFCASSVRAAGFQPGLVRSLTAGEMAGQVYLAQALAGQRVDHVVLMGIGEPLDNYDTVMDFISIITSGAGQNLSGRNLSLSTCGVVPGIRQLAKRDLPLTLSVSLHAADDATRSRLMPVNRKWPLAELMDACKAYRAATGRRISYEYTLFDGVNDGPENAARLAGLLAGQDAHVNLIGANPVQGSALRPASPKAVKDFAGQLAGRGVNATVRRRLGVDIDAACGQLRQKSSADQGRMGPDFRMEDNP